MDTLAGHINYIHARALSTTSILSHRARVELIKTEIWYLFDYVNKKYIKNAIQYYKQRNDEKLILAERKYFDLISNIKFDKNVQVFSASSFSARIHLVGDSDLDFVIGIPDFDKTKDIPLLPPQFIFKKELGKDNLKYIVYQTFDDENNVEIELKLRDLDSWLKVVYPMHKYQENLQQKIKIIITYIKYLLKQKNKDIYNKFKMLIYYLGAENSGQFLEDYYTSSFNTLPRNLFLHAVEYTTYGLLPKYYLYDMI